MGSPEQARCPRPGLDRRHGRMEAGRGRSWSRRCTSRVAGDCGNAICAESRRHAGRRNAWCAAGHAWGIPLSPGISKAFAKCTRCRYVDGLWYCRPVYSMYRIGPGNYRYCYVKWRPPENPATTGFIYRRRHGHRRAGSWHHRCCFLVFVVYWNDWQHGRVVGLLKIPPTPSMIFCRIVRR